jgi:hypothetical protein
VARETRWLAFALVILPWSAACDLSRPLAQSAFACVMAPCDAGSASSTDGASSGAADATVDAGGVLPNCDTSFDMTAACGGPLNGRYRFRRACGPYEFSDLLMCNGAIGKTQTSTPAGTVTITEPTMTGGNLSANCMLAFTEEILIPSACASFIPGGCLALESYLSAGTGSTHCETTSGGCDCTTTGVDGCIDSGAYMLSDDTLTSVTGKAYWYCAQGSTLILRPKDAEQLGHRFVFVFTAE